MEQQIVSSLKEIFKDEEKTKLLQNILQSIQNNSLQTEIEKINDINNKYDEIMQKKKKLQIFCKKWKRSKNKSTIFIKLYF